MKQYFYILFFCCLTGSLSAQSWKDSLIKAKKYYDAQHYEQSYATFLEAQKLAPGSEHFSQDIGTAAYKAGKYKEAEEAFNLATQSDNSPELKSKHWHNVGNSQMKQKQYSEAIKSYKNALRANPSNQNARYNLAVAKKRVQQKQQNKKNKDSQQKKQKKKSEGNEQNQNDSEKNSSQQQNPQQQNSTNKNASQGEQSSKTPQGKLSNNKSQQILRDLLNQEMKTKKKVRGIKSKKNPNQISDKQW